MRSYKRVIFFGAFSGEVNAKKRNFWFAKLKDHCFDSVCVIEYNGIDPRSTLFTSTELRDPHQVCTTKRSKMAGLLSLFFQSPSLLIGLKLQLHAILSSKLNNRRPQFFREYLQAVLALGQLMAILKQLNIGKNDIVITWGEKLPGQRLVCDVAEKRNALLLVSEYGEFQRTVFVSESGMLHKAWPHQKAAAFSQLPVTEADRAKATGYLAHLQAHKLTNKVYTSTFKGKEKILSYNRPVIYVNGMELFASSILPRSLKGSHEFSPRFGSNRHLLEVVLQAAKVNNWTVLYKDHPNTLAYNPHSIINDIKDDHLFILDNVDIYEVMTITDVTVTLGSKVVLLSLLSDVPVVMVGPFTITQNQITQGLIESTDVVPAIKKLLDNKQVSQNDLVDYTARMLKYFLYELEESDSLFNRNNAMVWNDIESYLAGERSVISAPLKLA